MTGEGRPSPYELGREIFGPIYAEFCLRLHMLGSFIDAQRPDDAVLLFCARGGLRMQLAWERFLTATELPQPLPTAPIMISRLAAIRPAIARTLLEDLPGMLPAVERTISYEFSNETLATTARALSGITPRGEQSALTTPAGLAALLRSSDGVDVADSILEQANLFTAHLNEARDGRSMPILVDTGLFGTIRAVLGDAYPDLDVRCLLLARTLRPDLVQQQRGTYGLSVEAEVYSSFRRRTSLIRYWHFVEWLFEPALESVKTFTRTSEGVRSNLEHPGWEETLAPDPGSVFAGMLEYLDALSPETVSRIPAEADRAWRQLRRAIVWPTPGVGRALEIGIRSHDFGRDGTWSAHGWRGPLDALRGSMMWREGEIARSGGAWRLPLHAVIESAYTARAVRRAATFRRRFGG